MTHIEELSCAAMQQVLQSDTDSTGPMVLLLYIYNQCSKIWWSAGPRPPKFGMGNQRCKESFPAGHHILEPLLTLWALGNQMFWRAISFCHMVARWATRKMFIFRALHTT